jgi:hypothetical protein
MMSPVVVVVTIITIIIIINIIIIIIIITIIITGKTALFEPYPSLEDSARCLSSWELDHLVSSF